MHFTHIISDTHFHHEKIISLVERPFRSVRDMNEALVSNWNAAVPEDGSFFTWETSLTTTFPSRPSARSGRGSTAASS